MGFSLTAMMGVLRVVGIAVSKREAIFDAVWVRFVPIAMTSLRR